ncbi:DNA polymerase III subunit alpha [Streptococcus sp. CSL10205-OR2]|uniref:DNA polymerase III subunit alpha n=1 Tax=Streptococcus sp. CSL10205-OR2 TaxID=2980558 RepID=UPI0021D86F5F|nr:DNA polymerase III subunit alpha [Streptococcus sp. CSL10205-OR2]MCU9533325.1 DNA polymerase III subunit alpha [Streptococcus sp. CSL10205-OR2]
MFVQLDTKTVYSFMDSLIDLDGYIQSAKNMGYSYLGIMDKDNLYAAYHFINKCHQNNLKPILGLETSILLDHQEIKIHLIAKNNVGYRHLLKLSTELMKGEKNILQNNDYFEELIIIIPYFNGIEELSFSFDYYIGVGLNSPIKTFHKPILPLHTVRYFENQDKEVLQVLHAIKDNVSLKETKPIEGNQMFYDASTMTKLFEERFPKALENLEVLVGSISYQFNSSLKLPRFNRHKDASIELREKTYQSLNTKNLNEDVYIKRLETELSIIHDMGFDDYFLIVWDLIRFGHSKGYYMGMGRGSAAGSLVAYLLDITGIDPVKNNLLFERFLNKERYSMPDIDIDLPDIYRSEFLHYVRDRYGSEHAAQIVTFSTFGAKQVIRDVFKRFGATEYELGALTKRIAFQETLTSTYEKNAHFRQIITSKLEFQKAFAIAKKIEGQPRQTSIHAAGVVLSDDNLTNHIPLKPGEDMMITQYDAQAVEANGLLKMDFLGLRNLTLVQKMKEKLLKEQGILIDIKAINLEDEKTLALFAQGKTAGIFQFEAAGAINLLKQIKPSRFEEIVATTSLNRPGASDYIDNFIKRKFKKEAIDLIDPVIAPILEPTYGIMLYQEQVMTIAQVYAGFSLGKADLLRRAMSKKNREQMNVMRSQFLDGAKQQGRQEETASLLFDMMAKFAGYGFNRSHAYAYSALAFQLAYFKAHYPNIFYDIMLNYSGSHYISDAIDNGFKVEKLSINNVSYYDKVVNNNIFIGIKHIKELPKELAFWIVNNQPYQNTEDFLTRLPEKYQDKKFIESLVLLGLFDNFEENRKKVQKNLEPLLIFVSELGSLFSENSYQWLDELDYTNAEKYQLEKDIIGFGISPHPLVEEMEKRKGQFTPFSKLVEGRSMTVLAEIEKIKVIRTKTTGEEMVFLTVSDTNKKLDITLFPETYKKYQNILTQGQFYLFRGKIQYRNQQLQMLLDTLIIPTDEKCWLLVSNHDNDFQITKILKQFPGSLPVVIHYKESKETLQSQKYFVAKDEKLIDLLNPYVLKTVFR